MKKLKLWNKDTDTLKKVLRVISILATIWCLVSPFMAEMLPSQSSFISLSIVCGVAGWVLIGIFGGLLICGAIIMGFSLLFDWIFSD